MSMNLMYTSCKIDDGLFSIQLLRCPVRYVFKKRLIVLKINTQVCRHSLFTVRSSYAKYA